MMGRLSHDQEQFFYSFRLDEAVPNDHPVREVAAVLDLSWVHSELAPYYPRIGRPSIDPVLMIRMLIIGYVFAIRSERALCRDVGVNLAYRWFCGLSIEDKIPDHSAFSRARNERFRDSGIFRSVFERIVGVCIGAGLVDGEGFAVDASLIVADANKQLGDRRWSDDELCEPAEVLRDCRQCELEQGTARPTQAQTTEPKDTFAFGLNHRLTFPRKKLERLNVEPEHTWDLMWNTTLIYSLFPNTVLMIQGDHVELARMFPCEGRVDRAVMELALYVPRAPATRKSACIGTRTCSLCSMLLPVQTSGRSHNTAWNSRQGRKLIRCSDETSRP